MADLRQMRGSITPLITPFRSGEIDLHTFERLTIRQFECGSDGVVVTGTSGEPTTLSARERIALFNAARAVVPSDRLLIAATGAESLTATTELTREAARLGADAAMVVTPAFSKPSQRALTEYYTRLAGAVDIPILLYNIPGRTGVALEAATVVSLAFDVPNIVGVKHSSTDLAFVSSVLRDAPTDFSLLCGLEELCLPMLALGAAGVMSAAANVLPREVAELCTRVEDGHLTSARKLHVALLEISRAVFWDTNPVPIKYLMYRLGLLSDPRPRSPLLEPDAELVNRLDALIGPERLVARSNAQRGAP